MATKKKILPAVSAEYELNEGAASEVEKAPQETQLQVFERAAKLFRAQQFAEARELFQTAAEGRQREISHNSRLHVIMCDRRLQKPEILARSLEDYYNLGVERLNARDLENARRNLEKAIELTRTDGDAADHVYYAMAACQALSGDSRGAYENLKRAIEIEPRNRVAARQDPDFGGSVQQPNLHSLIYPDRSSPF